MSRYREQFPNKTLFPVIHVEKPVKAAMNASIAHTMGADGVFLINHTIDAQELVQTYRLVRSENPGWFIGLNFLDLATPDALRTVPGDASALWVDDGGVSGHGSKAAEYGAIRKTRTDWPGLYFASAAFKYQRSVRTPEEEAASVAQAADVVVTSGPATGSAPDPAKIAAMRGAIAATPLAIASGITVENVMQFLGNADCFLVATSITRKGEVFDPLKVRLLANIIHGA